MNRSHLLVLLFVWIIGVVLGLNYEVVFPNLNETSVFNTKLEMKPVFGMEPNAWGFFINNLLVGMVIVISGWLTAGSLSCIISFWNAFIMGVLVNSATAMGLTYSLIAHKIIWHGSFEIVGLIIFGAIGLKGFNIMQAILSNKPLVLSVRNILGYSALATMLLFIAAIIENNVI